MEIREVQWQSPESELFCRDYEKQYITGNDFQEEPAHKSKSQIVNLILGLFGKDRAKNSVNPEHITPERRQSDNLPVTGQTPAQHNLIGVRRVVLMPLS